MVNVVQQGKIRLLNFIRLCNKKFLALDYDERTKKFYFHDVHFDDHISEVKTNFVRLDGLLCHLKKTFYPSEDGANFKRGFGRSSSTEVGKRVDSELNDYALCLRRRVSADFRHGCVPNPEWLECFSHDFYSKKRKLDNNTRIHLQYWRPFHVFTKKIIQYLAENGLYLLRTQIPVISIEYRILTYIDGVAFDLRSGKTVLLEVKTGFDRGYNTRFSKEEPYIRYECLHTNDKNIVASERNKHQLQLGFMWAMSGIINAGENPFDECRILLINKKISGVKVYKLDSWFKKEWVHLLECTGFRNLKCIHCEWKKGNEDNGNNNDKESQKTPSPSSSPSKQRRITDFFSIK